MTLRPKHPGFRRPSAAWLLPALLLVLVGMILSPAAAGAFDGSLPTITSGDQRRPDVATLASGGFVVAWIDRSSGVQIKAQIYNASGTPQRAEIEVAEVGNSQAVAVAGLADGNFVVVWDVYIDATNLYDINAQVFDASGNPVSGVFWPGATTDYEYLPAVGALSSGDFVVSWTKAPASGARSGRIYARRYSSKGEEKSNELLVNSTADSQSNSCVVGLANEEYIIVYDRVNWGITGWDVVGHKFNSSNSQVASFIASSDTLNIQWYPSAAKLTDNRFVVLWTDVDREKKTSLKARIFDFDCNAIGGDITVNGSAPWDRSHSSVAGLDGGGFAAVWTADSGGNHDVLVQRCDSSGGRSGGETRLSYASQDQQRARVAKRSGGFVVVWESNGEDGSGWSVMGRLF